MTFDLLYIYLHMYLEELFGIFVWERSNFRVCAFFCSVLVWIFFVTVTFDYYYYHIVMAKLYNIILSESHYLLE